VSITRAAAVRRSSSSTARVLVDVGGPSGSERVDADPPALGWARRHRRVYQLARIDSGPTRPVPPPPAWNLARWGGGVHREELASLCPSKIRRVGGIAPRSGQVDRVSIHRGTGSYHVCWGVPTASSRRRGWMAKE
jgi:hypothetical protein